MSPYQKLKELWAVPGYSTAEKVVGISAGLFIGACILLVGPFLTIWMLNTLFPALAIPFTFWTWLAALLLNLRLKSKFTTSSN